MGDTSPRQSEQKHFPAFTSTTKLARKCLQAAGAGGTSINFPGEGRGVTGSWSTSSFKVYPEGMGLGRWAVVAFNLLF